MSIRDEVLKILRGSSNTIRDGETIAALINRTKTTELDLPGKGLNGGHAKIVAHALKSNSTLTKLDMDSNQIGDEGSKATGEALKSNSTLTRLNVNWNQIGAEGAKAIGEALKSNSTLSELYIHWNQIGDEGSKAIGEALKSNSTLSELYIQKNQIGDEGSKAIGEALKSNSTLSELYIQKNQIGDEGSKAIGEALKSNSTLSKLSIWDNQIGAEGIQYLLEALKTNITLLELYLKQYGNNLRNDGNLRILFVEKCDIFTFEDAVNDRNVLKHFGIESTASSTRWTFESFCNHLKSQGRLPVYSPQNQLLPPPSLSQQPSHQVFASSESSLKEKIERSEKVIEGINMTSDVTVTGRQADGSLIYAQKKSNIHSSTTKGKVSSDHELIEDLMIELRYLKSMVEAHQNAILLLQEEVYRLNTRTTEEDDKKYLKEAEGKKG